MAVQTSTKKQVVPVQIKKSRNPWIDAYRQLIKNKAAVVAGIFVIAIILVAIFANYLAPYHYADVNFDSTYAKPGNEFPAGADALGRGILSRTLYGARVSLTIGIVGATVSLIIGLVYGLVSGYFGGWVDNLMMRLVDFMYGLPDVILVILMQVYFKAVSRRQVGGFAGVLVNIDSAMGGLFFIFIALGMFNWIGMARLARGQVLAVKEKEYVYAARSVGAGYGRIIFRHVMSNILGPCIVAETMAIPGYIFAEAFLSFIGLGVNPPTPSWGAMITDGYQGLRSNSHLIMAPSIALTLTVLAFNFLGDGLRDAFDPRLRGVIAGHKMFQGKKQIARRRWATGLVSLLVVAVVGFALARGRGVSVLPTPLGEQYPTTYVTEHGHEVTLAQVRYDPAKPGTVTSVSLIPGVNYTPVGNDILGIIERGEEVVVLGESVNEQGVLYYLVRGRGTEGWMPAVDVTLDEP